MPDPLCNLIRCLPIETILCFAVVFFSGFYKRLPPFGMIHGIREELGLQTNTAASGIINTVLTGFLGVVSRIQLHTGTIGLYGHMAAADGIGKTGAGIAEYLEIVVIAEL